MLKKSKVVKNITKNQNSTNEIEKKHKIII